MIQREKDSLLADIDAGLVLLGGSRPMSPPAVRRAREIFEGVKVACQSIPVTPVDESGQPLDPTTPGPEDPPVDPGPEEPPPGGGGGGSSGPPPEPTTTTTTYTSAGDFNTVQGYRGWYYLEENGTSMTYNATNSRWEGSLAFQFINATGQHPAAAGGSMRRWTAQGTGTYAITGSVSDATPGGSTGIQFTIFKNGVAIYGPQAMADGGSLTLSGLTGSTTTGDTFDFLVKDPLGDIGQDGTNVAVSVALTTPNTSGTGGQTQTQLPFLLNGTPPQEGTLTLTMNKPANADSCTLAVTGVNLAADYGRLYFNGTANSVAIWATAPGNSGISATVQLPVPVAYVQNGQNTLRFTHATGSGYTVTAVSPSFTTPATPTPPATQTSLPFVLTGSILPEDGLLTMNISKPANPATCTIAVTGIDLAEADGTMQVNSTSNSMTIWPVNSANNGASRTVNLSVSPSWFNNGTNTIRFIHTSGDGFTVQSVSVSFTTQPDPEPPVGGAWPNEPGNFTVLTEHNWSTRSGNGWNPDFTTGQIVSDPTAPFSPPNVLFESWVNHNFPNVSKSYYLFPAGVSYFYLGCWWKPSNPFYGWLNVQTQKIFLLEGTHTYLSMFRTSGTGASSVYTLLVTPDGAAQNNTHIGGTLGGTTFFPNVTSISVPLGQWNRLEWLYKMSTTSTSRDGEIHWWMNNTKMGQYTNVNTGVRTVSQMYYHHVWDQVDPQQVTDSHWLDHVRISRL